MINQSSQGIQFFAAGKAASTAVPKLTVVAADKINALGPQPFILVQIEREGGSVPKWTICPTQNEAGAFVTELAALPEYGQSKLLQAIDRGLRTEVYESAELMFVWAFETSDAISQEVLLQVPEEVSCAAYVGYPVFRLGIALENSSSEEKISILETSLNAYASTQGNDALRFFLIEALAFGLSRVLGELGRHDEAVRFVNKGLLFRPYSIYLKAAKQALTLKLDGKAVPERLIKFIGKDNGYLRQFVCPEPFKRFDIGPSGDVLVCCGHWLPQSIGNFMRDPIENVLNSSMAQKVRQSVTDGSYQYCNHLECGAMIQETLPTRDELHPPKLKQDVADGKFTVQGIEQVLFAFDQTCNLSCPSCRQERITEKASDSEEKTRAVEEKLLPLLPHLRILNINPAGELFASKPSRKILELINDELCPDLMLDIISNGTLFSEDEWNKFPGIHNKVRSIRISVDAAHKHTFEKLRRLGKYEVFLQNMRFLAKLRETNVIPQLKFSFTYQLDNFCEMADFVRFGVGMNCDFIIFERLQNLGTFSTEEFLHLAVHRPEHPLHGEFLDVVCDPIFRATRIWHDFDYEGIENLSPAEAKLRAPAYI